MIALIMAGGIGTRFWPLSRESKPKQFLNIISSRSMIQMTVDRLLKKINIEDIYVVTSVDQAPLVREQLPDMPWGNVIIEPFGRNTAPCIGLSAIYLNEKYDPNETMIVLPADHLIKNEDEFLNKIELAEQASNLGYHVTFGIKPHYPATGYGYIESEGEFQDGMFHVKQFKEKPDFDTAQQFLEAGNYYWNSGMFVWKISTILNSYRVLLPAINNQLEAIKTIWYTKGFESNISDPYQNMPKIPVDIGIMEQTNKRIVIPVDLGWSDVGGWKSLYDISSKDEKGNVLGENIEAIDAKNCLVKSDKFVALIGVENLIVVDTDDALLITTSDKSEKVKDIYSSLLNNNSSKLT
jgi:mannose-1-phosphate guanylyltransferase